MTARRHSAIALIAAAVLGPLLLVACRSHDHSSNVVHWYVFHEPSGAFAETARRCSQASHGRFRIEIAPLPSDADQQREQLVRRLAARDDDIDVVGMDIIWTAEFAEAGWILPWEEGDAESIARGTLHSALRSATYRNRLFAAPFTTNVQLLWYRTDLVPPDRVDAPPTTWEEILGTAERLAEQGKPHTVQVQGDRYEGLVVWFNSVLASAGGSVLDDDGEVSLAEQPTLAALRILRRLSSSVAAPASLSTTKENEARLAFEAGDSAFMLNWPFVWPSAERNAPHIAETMGWARYPAVEDGRPSRVTLGGLNLGIGAFSEHPALAREAARCLRDEGGQLLAAVRGGLLPTLESLYGDPRLRDAFPFADTLRETLLDATQRPQSPAYNDLSLGIQRVLHPTRDIEPRKDVGRLRRTIDDAIHSRGLL